MGRKGRKRKKARADSFNQPNSTGANAKSFACQNTKIGSEEKNSADKYIESIREYESGERDNIKKGKRREKERDRQTEK